MDDHKEAKEAQNPKELRFTLLENGLDFMKMGIEGVYGSEGRNDPRSYKYALLHIFAGALLLLKERLRREHFTLIYKDVAQAKSKDAKTVDFDEVIKRLAAAGVNLEEADIKLLRRVQQKRNALEHYEVDLKIYEADALIGELVEFLDRFLPELDERLEKHIAWDAWEGVERFTKIAAKRREERIAEWRARAAAYADMDEDALSELSDDSIYHPKHNPDARDLEYCEHCGEMSLAVVERDIGKCTNPGCGEIEKVSTCPRCSRLVIGDVTGFCDDCLQEIMDKD